eukprot:5779917-Pleurochrysis_carterae.AAC.2
MNSCRGKSSSIGGGARAADISWVAGCLRCIYARNCPSRGPRRQKASEVVREARSARLCGPTPCRPPQKQSSQPSRTGPRSRAGRPCAQAKAEQCVYQHPRSHTHTCTQPISAITRMVARTCFSPRSHWERGRAQVNLRWASEIGAESSFAASLCPLRDTRVVALVKTPMRNEDGKRDV